MPPDAVLSEERASNSFSRSRLTHKNKTATKKPPEVNSTQPAQQDAETTDPKPAEPQNKEPATQDAAPEIDKNQTPEYYRNLILSQYTDILVDTVPVQLPPFRKVNHCITVRIEKLWISLSYRLPEAHKKALDKDLDLKIKAGIIVPTMEVPLATSHMCRKRNLEPTATYKTSDEETKKLTPWFDLCHNMRK